MENDETLVDKLVQKNDPKNFSQKGYLVGLDREESISIEEMRIKESYQNLYRNV